MYNNLAVLALFVFLYSLFSNRLERSNFGGAVLFTVFGLLVGPLGIEILDLNVDGELLRLLALITWILFGSAVVGQHIGQLNWHIILYALLSLTVVRMVPVFLALAGTRLYNAEKLFIGWFGPRGMASIVFGVIVLNANLPGSTTIVLTTACTIILSIVAHGISAHPLELIHKRLSKNWSWLA